MLDIKIIRSDLDLVKKSVNRRGKDYSELVKNKERKENVLTFS